MQKATTQAVIGALKAASIQYAQYSTRPRRLTTSGVEVDQIGRLIVVQYRHAGDLASTQAARPKAMQVAAKALEAAGFVITHMENKGMIVVRARN